MAIMFDGPVLPDDLTTFVREVPPIQNVFLNRILPDRHVLTNRVDVGMLTKTGRTARFRAYDAPPHVAKRNVAQLSTVQLPPLSDSLPMGELERLQLEFARTGGTNQAAFVNQIYDDATDLTLNVQRRMELARGDVLVDGKFTLAGEGGLWLEADYQVPSGNLVTAGTLWSDTTNSDPLSDENSWVTSYINLNGFPPGGQLISRQTLNQLMSNAKLRQATGSLLGSNILLTRTSLDAVLDQHMLPPIVGIYDSSFDVDGTSTRAIPANKVIFVPPADQPLGYTAWGISATALEFLNSGLVEMTFEEAPGIVGFVDKADSIPFRQAAMVDAVGMPVIENSWLLFVATVA